MVISHNLTALNAQRQYNITFGTKAKSTEKLSSGYKINRAADDAAGLAISEKMRRQIRGLNQGAANIQEGISYVQVADGALNEVHDILNRINELSVKSANGTNTPDERFYMDQEVQELKNELSRIFETTSFNEQKIWGEGSIVKQIGEEVTTTTNEYPAVVFNTFNSYSNIDNNNRGAVPRSSITFSASDDGLVASWTGFDGTNYSSDKIPWDSELTGTHSFKLSDHMDYSSYPQAQGIDFTYIYTVDSRSTLSDIKNAFNSGSASYPAFYTIIPVNTTNMYSNPASGAIRSSATIVYDAQLASSKSFTAGDTSFMEFVSMVNPANPSVSDNTKFSFKFTMPGIGNVTANVSSAYYTGNYSANIDDRTGENVWWREQTRTNGTKYKSALSYSGDGSLNSIIDSITNTSGHSLWTDNASGGTYNISFSLLSDSPYTCMNGSQSRSIGSLNMIFSITKSSSPTQAGLVSYITGVLNNLTGIDVYDNDNISPSNIRIYKTTDANSSNKVTETIEHKTPIYEYDDKIKKDIRIQASGNPDDGIHILYDNLTNHILGIENLNVLDIDSSSEAIGLVKNAMEIISDQRSNFGSYQNRLEHAYYNDLNISENTQAAESRIRDTDMATEMVRNSLYNILLQAGQSIMAQANQSNSGVLALL